MLRLRVVATTPSKPSSFASTVTREQTSLDDKNGVWQKDRGGKFNNYLNVDLEVQDLTGRLVALEDYFPVEAELRIVMEDGKLGGVVDRVTLESRRVMNKHLEGGAGKLMIIDADPQTAGGLRVGGTSRTTIKTRINELSKKGSRNSRFSVVYRPVGPGSQQFIQDDIAASSRPLTVYSKVVRSARDETLSDHLEQAKLAAKTLLSEVEKVDPSRTSQREAQVVVEILEACRLIQKKLQWQATRQSSGKHVDIFDSITNAASAAAGLSSPVKQSTASDKLKAASPTPMPMPMSLPSSASAQSALLQFDDSSKRLRQLDRSDQSEWSGRLVSCAPGMDVSDQFLIDFAEDYIGCLEDDNGAVNLSTEVNITERFIKIDFFDENKDGSIDRSEMQNAIVKLEIPLTEEMHRRIFEDFDEDKDGKITLDEFVRGLKKKEDELLPLFRQLDSDGDGYLTFDELRKSSHLQEVSDEAIKELIDFVDSLSSEAPDGRISEREFISTFTMLPSGENLESLRSFAHHVTMQKQNSSSALQGDN